MFRVRCFASLLQVMGSTWRKDRVGIDEEKVCTHRFARAEIAALGEPNIAMTGEEMNPVLFFGKFEETLRDMLRVAVVDNDDLADFGSFDQTGQAVPKNRARLIRDDDGGNHDSVFLAT